MCAVAIELITSVNVGFNVATVLPRSSTFFSATTFPNTSALPTSRLHSRGGGRRLLYPGKLV